MRSLSRGERDTQITLDLNLLVIDFAGHRVLFDAGAGSVPELGGSLFGASVGHVEHALRAAGIERSSIDLVALSHLHPDHAWGLLRSDGRASFPNAQVLVGRRELAQSTNDTVGPPIPAACAASSGKECVGAWRRTRIG